MKMISTVVSFIHKYFLLLLLSAYVLAVLCPQAGLYLRHISFGKIILPNNSINVSPSFLMLATLLFNAGLGISIQEIKGIFKRPILVSVGFLANFLVPIALIFLLRAVLGLWHNNDELQNLLTGLALIIAMPIAGSSTAWSQNANGNMSLSLALVLFSTLTSPIVTPWILHFFGFITTGDYSEDLHELAAAGADWFMFFTVAVPSLLGSAIHFLFGYDKIVRIKTVLKLLNFVILLVLNYSNAATSLPQAFAKPDWDFLSFILAVTSLMCLCAFGAGWLVSKLFKTNKADMAALIFGLGMNNNGTGLVFAATALSDHPTVLLPLVFYTMIQQIMAAIIYRLGFKEIEKESDQKN